MAVGKPLSRGFRKTTQIRAKTSKTQRALFYLGLPYLRSGPRGREKNAARFILLRFALFRVSPPGFGSGPRPRGGTQNRGNCFFFGTICWIEKLKPWIEKRRISKWHLERGWSA